MANRPFVLAPCSSSKSSPGTEFLQGTAASAAGSHSDGGECKAESNQIEEEETAAPRRSLGKNKRKKGIVISKRKKFCPPPPSSSSSSTTSSSSCSRRRLQQHRQLLKGLPVGRIRNRGGKQWAPKEEGLGDLALPLGMSFAAVVSRVLDGTSASRNKMPVERLSRICTSAVKESVANIYGNRFDCFLLNFERSFGSTLRTLRLINEASFVTHGNRRSSQVPVNEISISGCSNKSYHEPVDGQGYVTVHEPQIIEGSSFQSSSTYGAVGGDVQSHNAAIEKIEDIPLSSNMSNQIVLHGQINQELASVSHRISSYGSCQSILNTFERSVMEQTRSNDLKAFEIGLIRRKIELKESQLALNSYSNMLERIKISMGISKASFKEEKLKNQMLDIRHAEFLRRCMDLLVAGLIIMSFCLGYGTYSYSYQRITEATSSCSDVAKGSSSWWMTKSMASFNSGLLMLRCHVVALTRLFFGIAIIVAMAYCVFQRSAVSTPTTMPVTFILLLGFLCGIAGKLCVDTLGGNGFYWLIHWESLCLFHFFANIFPAACYGLLYGRVSVSHTKSGARLLPYWLRSFLFHLMLAVVYPALAGLLPFASLMEWKKHLYEKVNHLIVGVED